jgi:hypothetical protein
MKFSQRVGITPAIKVAQIESMDEDLRNGLWSALCLFYWPKSVTSLNSLLPNISYDPSYHLYNLENLIKQLWLHYFKYPVDRIDRTWRDDLRKYYFSATWYEIYDFIEFIANCSSPHRKSEFIQVCNSYLERENSAYRFIGDSIAEITSTEEIEEIEQAIIDSTPYTGVKDHLKSALSLMSNKTNPDYRNSIKESISSVESLAKQISQKNTATLGDALKELEKSNFSEEYCYSR